MTAPERVKKLEEALKEVVSDLFYQLESKHGPRKAYEYPSIAKAKALLKTK